MLTSASWPFTYAGLPPSELFCLSTSKTSMFFTLSWLWTSVCSGIAATTDLSAQFKCHPLLSTLHQCPFTVSLGLCVSRITKEGIWHLCVFWVFVPHSEPGGRPEDSLCSPFHLVLYQYGSDRIVLSVYTLGRRIAEQRSAKSKSIRWQTRPRASGLLITCLWLDRQTDKLENNFRRDKRHSWGFLPDCLCVATIEGFLLRQT